MNPKSHTLFHFTKSGKILREIIINGFWPRYCLEDVGWLGLAKYDFVAYPMVCFCDIPLSRVDEHVNFYGEYGIGMTKEWAESNKLTPILYVAPNNNIPHTFRAIINLSKNLCEDDQNNIKQQVRYLLAHSKPTEGSMVISGKVVPKEFHQELEWRYVPKNYDIFDCLYRSEFEDDKILNSANSKTKESCSIAFEPKDIRYIFVRKDSDIPGIINFIQQELDSYPSADLKVLMSRVTSLESISRDL